MKEQSYRALTVLTRLAQRRPESSGLLKDALEGRLESLAEVALDVAIDTGDPIGMELAEVLRDHGSFEMLRRVQDLCDEDRYLLSVPLREVARVSTEGTLAALRQEKKEMTREETFDYVVSANNLALRLYYLNSSKTGLSTIQEAVSVCRRLAEEDASRFLPELARTLSTLGVVLGEVDRQDEALEALEEALGILRELAPFDDELLPDLAGILTNLGSRLNRLGRREDGFQATEEAVEIYRKVAWKRPDPLLSFFSASLHHLGNCLNHRGDLEEALRASQEAVEIIRRLTELRPDAFRHDLATALHNLARRLNALDFHEEALQADREAYEIRTELVKRRPEAFLPAFSRSLMALGKRLQQAGKAEAALQITREGGQLVISYLARLSTAPEGSIKQAMERYLELCEIVGEIPSEAVELTQRFGTR